VDEPEEGLGHEPDLEDEADTEDLSNWNVPSWQELIASLNRP
jgi:hypothetical protein